MLKGGLPCQKNILLAVLDPWVEYCSQEFFVPVVLAEIEVEIASVPAVVESGRGRT